jgi:tetratricopeptide (TPR) repeat protein
MLRAYSSRLVLSLLVSTFALTLDPSAARADKKPQTRWMRISSSHFSVLTDAGEAKGREVAVRFEQMRAEFGQLLLRPQLKTPVPIEIIALKNDEDYARIAPPSAINQFGFFLPGEDRNFVVLNLFEDNGWRAVSSDYAHELITYNYPQTQPWFDEGLVEYFSSLQMDDKLAWIGGDPELPAPAREKIIGNSMGRRSGKSFIDLLGGPVWLEIPDLFTMRHDSASHPNRGTLFYAESWIVVHYLINSNRLPQTGTYFDLVENQKLPVEKAIQQAYGVTPEEFSKAIKNYYRAIEPKLRVAAGESSVAGRELYQMPAPVTADVVGTSRLDLPEADGDALLAEMEIRVREHRDDAVKRLNVIVNAEPKVQEVAAHRALAWDDMQRKQFDDAEKELVSASQIDPKDPWSHYQMALVKVREAQAAGHDVLGLANLMIDLKLFIDAYPDSAEAHHMLAMAQLQGGGFHSALDSIRIAVQLNPRSQQYLLDMALVYIGGKKWEEATALLNRLQSSSDPKIAQESRKNLSDLPMLRKYGIPPQQQAAAAPQVFGPKSGAQGGDDDDDDAKPTPMVAVHPQPDKRLIQFLKGKLLDIDCSQSPAAILTVAGKVKTMKFRTEDFHSLVLIGADQFSCEWRNKPVMVNFKAGGKSDGDLVSLELE